MDKIRDISINEAVLHVLDNNSDEPILNNYKLELNEEIYKFILSHTQRVLKDENLKYALYKSKVSTVKSISLEYLNGRVNLLQASKIIAEQLFTFMKSNVGIPSCDLLVISFATEYGPMLGILKMDYIKHYTHEINVVDDVVGINIAPIITGLPVTKKVQKAAFIKPIGKGDYDLLVLDKQSSKENNEYEDNYFINNFLGCTLIDNDRDMTKSFLDAAEIWTRSNFRGEAVRAEAFRSVIKDNLKSNDAIDIYDIAQRSLSFEESRKNFIAYMQQNDIEKFNVDKEYLEKKLNKIKIKVSSEIELSITKEAYSDINKFEIRDNGDGSIHIVIKNVEDYVEK